MEFSKLLFYIYLLSFIKLYSSIIIKEIKDNLLESKYKDDYYIKAYKIPQSLITFTTNGERIYKRILDYAFDDDYETFWSTNSREVNSEPINIKITFSTTITIDKLLYKAPLSSGIEGYGYPTQLKIYIKLKNIDGIITDDDSDFLLIEDIISEKTGNLILFQFEEEITCDQIKLEWANLEDSDTKVIFPAASEIIFLSPENKYIEQLLDIFMPNDYRHLLIRPEIYNDYDAINKLETQINIDDRMSEAIEEIIKRLKKIKNKELQFDSRREFTTNQTADKNIIHQYGDVASYSNKILKMKRGGTDRQTTGIFGFSNESITIYVDAKDDEINLPSISFSQYRGNTSNWLSTSYKLKKGKNVLVFTYFDTQKYEFQIKSGGPIYIENKFDENEQSQNIRIYIEGGTLFPVFRLNDDENEFKSIMNEYILNIIKYPDNYFNIAEMESNHVMITVNATEAYENYNIKGKSPQDNLLHWDEALKKYYIFDGIQFEENQTYYDYKNNYIKIHIRYSQRFRENVQAYASREHIGIFLKDDLYRVIVSTEGIGDTLAHEIGHMIDVIPREIAEETNNVIKEFSLETIDKYRGIRDSDYNYLTRFMTPDNISTILRGCRELNISDCKGLYTSFRRYKLLFLLWWEIESLYNGYWGKLDNLYRYNYSLVSSMSKTEGMVYLSSYITGLDLGYYFERYAFFYQNEKPFNNSDTSEKYKEKMKELINSGKIDNKIQKKFWYIDIDEYNYISNNGTGCYNNNDNYNIEIKNIFRNDTFKCYNISFPQINCKGHLGFEIYENDIIIGFTHKEYYLDFTKYPESYTPVYKIMAYDRLLDHSKLSEHKIATTNSDLKKRKKFLDFYI